MKKLFLLVVVFTISFAGYGQQARQTTIHLSEKDIVPVKHDELRISLIEFVQPANGHHVLIHSSPTGISVINNEGKLITHLGRPGSGPFEWRTPRHIQALDENIIIWDANGAKFLVFNKDLHPVEERLGVRPGIERFQFKDSRNVAILQEIPNQKEFVGYYTKGSDGRFSLEKHFGNLSDEGRVMFFMLHAGGVLWNEDDLIYCDPAIPELNVLDTRENRFFTVAFNDELFSVDPWNYTRETPERIREFIFSNSRIVSLQKMEDHILAEVEHFVNGQAMMKYHLFDFDYNYMGSVEAGEGGWAHYIRGVEGNLLYFWGEDYNETGEMNHIRVREVIAE